MLIDIQLINIKFAFEFFQILFPNIGEIIQDKFILPKLNETPTSLILFDTEGKSLDYQAMIQTTHNLLDYLPIIK